MKVPVTEKLRSGSSNDQAAATIADPTAVIESDDALNVIRLQMETTDLS